VTSQDPTRFDNYPPEPDPRAADFEEPSDDLPRRAVLPPPPDSHVGRRVAIGLLIGVPVLSLSLAAINRTSSPSPSAEATAAADPTGQGPTGTGSGREQVAVGGHYTVTVPDGWTYVGDGGGGFHFSNGVNRLSASGREVPPSTRAVEELDLLARQHHEDFTGKINDPADDSTDHVQRAHLIGSGKFQGISAMLIAELWIDEFGSGLLTKQLLTVSPSSDVAMAAQRMVDELSASF